MSRAGTITALGVICLTCLLYRDSLVGHTSVLATVAVLVGVLSVAAIMRSVPGRPWTMGSSFALLLALFHLGLLPTVAITGRASTFYESDRYWLLEPQFSMAILTATVAQAAFASAYLFCLGRRNQNPSARVPDEGSETCPRDLPALAWFAPALLLGGVVSWFLLVLSAGVSFSGTTYPEFLSATKKSPLPWAYLAMGLGFSASAACPQAWVRRLTILAFCMFAVVAFPIGLRGEVLIPLAAYGVVATRQRRNLLRGRHIALLLAVGLALGSLVRIVRLKGLQAAEYRWSDLNPLHGLTELGYSIRPLVAVHGYHDVGHEPFVGLATYLAPFKRIILGQLLDQPVVPTELDPSVFSTTMASRVGTVGGSIVAEAYRANGMIAVIALMVMLGVGFTLIDTSSDMTVFAGALIGMTSFIVLLWLRNDFTPVPVQFAAALVVAATALAPRASTLSRRYLYSGVFRR